MSTTDTDKLVELAKLTSGIDLVCRLGVSIYSYDYDHEWVIVVDETFHLIFDDFAMIRYNDRIEFVSPSLYIVAKNAPISDINVVTTWQCYRIGVKVSDDEYQLVQNLHQRIKGVRDYPLSFRAWYSRGGYYDYVILRGYICVAFWKNQSIIFANHCVLSTYPDRRLVVYDDNTIVVVKNCNIITYSLQEQSHHERPGTIDQVLSKYSLEDLDCAKLREK